MSKLILYIIISCTVHNQKHFRLFLTEGDADADKKEKVEDVENAEPVAS